MKWLSKQEAVNVRINQVEAWLNGGEIKAIAAISGISRSRVAQIISEVFRDIRHPRFMHEKPPCAEKYFRYDEESKYWRVVDFSYYKKEKKLALENKDYWLRRLKEYSSYNNGVQVKERLPLNTEVCNMEMSVRARNCLIAENIYFLDQILIFAEWELSKVPNLGKKTILEIRDVLNQNGYHFNGEYCSWDVGMKNDSEKNVVGRHYMR